MKPSLQKTAGSPAPHDAFFADSGELHAEARAQAVEVITRFLIWTAEAATIEQRGLRATVALYCVRPDLIKGITLEQIGILGGCTGQTVHKLAKDFRNSMGVDA